MSEEDSFHDVLEEEYFSSSLRKHSEKSEMADKSAFVPVDAIGNHKNTDLDVDIDDELFGKKPPKATASVTKAATAPAPAPPSVIKAPTSPAPKPAAAAAPAAGKYQYKKSTTYQKAYAK
ncbi:hypothetical protein L5515_010238 [Caenorhabditis briggsae]|uniref:Uncharacterized protein n=1 Tax=Caenorhabditis briggsae TaxID=6238 RepID=A0AAE9ERD1_CAEBR|nr:hypothetical protein L5515_010238 [Caenorhabditis briggsae]